MDEWIQREIERKTIQQAKTNDSTPLAETPIEAANEGKEQTEGTVVEPPAEGNETEKEREDLTAMETVEEPPSIQEETQAVGLTTDEHEAMTLGDLPLVENQSNLPAPSTLTNLPASIDSY